MASLQLKKTGFDQKEDMLLLFACSETVEYTLVKLETGRTVIPPLTMVIHWPFSAAIIRSVRYLFIFIEKCFSAAGIRTHANSIESALDYWFTYAA